MKKYEYTERCREISGFGGGYEKACRDMVIAGMEWLDQHKECNPKFKEYKNIIGVCTEDNNDAMLLSEAIVAAVPDCSGAMHQAAINHCLYANRNGWDKYIQEMEQTP